MDKTSVPTNNTTQDNKCLTRVDVQMQWFFLRLTALWIITAMVLPLVAFYLTRNPVCLSGFTILAPPVYILYRIAKYLFPRCDSDYRIELEKIRAQGVSHKKHNGHSHRIIRFFNPLKNANWPGQ